jgi:hypothetical protein
MATRSPSPVRSRAAAKPADPAATALTVREKQLTLFDVAPWADDMRALPNDYARSALFTVRNKRVPRAALQNETIFHINAAISITYTGIELRASDDELVWMQVLEYAKRAAAGTPVSFTVYELCVDLGWSINGRYYQMAEECLSRLQATAIKFASERLGRLESVSLIHRFRMVDRGTTNAHCEVQIDADMLLLFSGQHYAKVVWDKYRCLTPGARRLFDYFASHKQPFPLAMETFRKMCGSDSTRPKKWREQTKGYCDELTQSGLIDGAWLANDLIHCVR